MPEWMLCSKTIFAFNLTMIDSQLANYLDPDRSRGATRGVHPQLGHHIRAYSNKMNSEINSLKLFHMQHQFI